jgi:hypothetical protein
MFLSLANSLGRLFVSPKRYGKERIEKQNMQYIKGVINVKIQFEKLLWRNYEATIHPSVTQ